MYRVPCFQPFLSVGGAVDKQRWRSKTDATILTAPQASNWKREGGRYLVGVMGFSGAWRRSGLRGAALAAYVADITAALRAVLTARQAQWGERLVMCSGATDIGVPGAAYHLCAEMDITAMGVTAGAAIRYSIAPLQVLVPIGRRFGDESHVFVRLCDEFVLLGGGTQSAAETREANQQNKPITVICGFGGVADDFTALELPDAIFTHPIRTSS